MVNFRMEEEERTITKTGSGWSAKFTKYEKQGSLRLTNKRLIFGGGKPILLDEIRSVEIETRIANVTRIKIRLMRGTEYIDFGRHTPGHMVHLLAGEFGITHSEVSSYTAYWASLITMAVFMFGKNFDVERIARTRVVWCQNCEAYVDIPRTDEPVKTINCPTCGNKGMSRLSPHKSDKPVGWGRTI
jgi:hypothetical protein